MPADFPPLPCAQTGHCVHQVTPLITWCVSGSHEPGGLSRRSVRRIISQLGCRPRNPERRAVHNKLCKTLQQCESTWCFKRVLLKIFWFLFRSMKDFFKNLPFVILTTFNQNKISVSKLLCHQEFEVCYISNSVFVNHSDIFVNFFVYFHWSTKIFASLLVCFMR